MKKFFKKIIPKRVFLIYAKHRGGLIKLILKLICVKIQQILMASKYSILSLFSRKIGINKQKKRHPSIIVSLTTYPDRFNVVHLAIESLLNQTIKPNKIVLWLSKEEVKKFPLPKRIYKLQKRGVSLKFVNENLRQYKKLIYALREYKDSIIITADDDVIYPKWWLEGLLKTHRDFPNATVAYWCLMIKKDGEKKLKPYISWNDPTIRGPHHNLFPIGVGGILYPPKCLNNEVFNKKIFLKICPSGDDIWFKSMALLNNTKTVMVKEKVIKFPVIINSQKTALWHINVRQNKNDEQLKKVFDYYNLYQCLEK